MSPITSNRLPQIAAAAKPVVERAVAQTAFQIENRAKQFLVEQKAVDTGYLMGSVAAAKERELTWRVTAHADYAIYIEMGTRRKNGQARPYLDPALRLGEQFLTSAIKGIV